jgi:diguanylate cyclase (GGDEF)-like protein/PAS domain S-box-containing protein
VLHVISCIRDDHDIRLVALAGLICLMASIASILLLRHARAGAPADRLGWSLAAGLVSGSAIWATHFVAMLGYDPGFILGYHIGATLLSLAISTVGLTAGFCLAVSDRAQRFRWDAGIVAGGSIAAMHYAGMQAIELPATLIWSPGWVALSIAFAIVPVIPALNLALDRHTARSAIGAGCLLGGAVLLLHFTGMTGMTVIPSAYDVRPGSLLSPLTLGYVIAGVSLGILLLCLIAVLASMRVRRVIDTQERQLGLLVQGISDCAIYMLDSAGRVLSWNTGAERMKGYAAGEIVGAPIDAFYALDDRIAGRPEANLRHALENGRFSEEGWRLRKDGSRFWAHVTIEAVRDGRGIFRGYAKLTRDMTAFKAAQDELTTLASNLDTALSNMRQGLCLFDGDERLVMANARAGEMFGVTGEECPEGTPFETILRLGVEKGIGSPPPATLMRDVVERHRACIARADGGSLTVPFSNGMTVEVSHRPMAGGGWVTTFDDVTERHRADARIAHMALHDELTGLPNRPNFTALLDDAMEKAAADGGRLAMIGIDLDRFKEVNDIYGHAIGDAVLRTIAGRMQAACDPGAIVSRFGGDEFAAFASFAEDPQCHAFLSRLEACLNQPIEQDGMTIFPGASIGVALFPEHGLTRETIVNNADLAMYRAKEMIVGKTCFYSQDMDEAARARRLLANDLREAIARNELSLAYQVQRAISTNRVTGYEALLRWQHPRNGLVSPAEFIPIAEESGEIVRIGEWVLRTACSEAASWPEPHRVAVNLSPIQMMQPDLVEIVTNALVSSGLSPGRLELEITETALISDKARALHVLRQIKALGVTIAIDDFGTGYSSLDTLNSFPFDKIKIDQSFLLQSDTSHQARAIIRAVLALGHSLEVPVLAEGLETADQLQLLHSEGCD